MSQYPSQARVPSIFLHVPKSAGSTLRTVFHQALGDELLWFRNPESRQPAEAGHPRLITDLSLLERPESWMGVRLVGGHFPAWKLPLGLRERRPLLMAVLREPVARIESLYTYIRRERSHILHAELQARTLREALELPAFRRVVPQGQLRFLRTTQRPFHARLLAPFPVLIGKHEHLPAFVAAASRRTGLDLDLADVSANVSPSGYRDALREQPGYEEARALIASLTEDEAEFMRSFDQLYEHEAGDGPVETPRTTRPRAASAPMPLRTQVPPLAPVAAKPAPASVTAAATPAAAKAPSDAQADRRAARREARRSARQAERRRSRQPDADPQDSPTQ